jgi:hypothetical protein
MQSDWAGLTWSAWVPLNAGPAERREHISIDPGVYRVRAIEPDLLAYIGQTGRSLRERTRALSRHTYRESADPPWNDPHTAAPALWAWRVEDGLVYEVSVAPVEAETASRQCLEDMLLYRYRLEVGESTLANHGRFHPDWSRPTNRARGRGMTRLAIGSNPAALPSLPPAPLVGEPEGKCWLDLVWSPVAALESSCETIPELPGVYRLLAGGEVVYLGESKSLKDRLRAHAIRFVGQEMECSWVEMPGALPHHLKERETDLIGAFFSVRETPPRLQYSPSR